MSAASHKTWFSALSSSQKVIFTTGMANNKSLLQRQIWRLRTGEKWIRKQSVVDFEAWERKYRTVPRSAANHGNKTFPDPGFATGSAPGNPRQERQEVQDGESSRMTTVGREEADDANPLSSEPTSESGTPARAASPPTDLSSKSQSVPVSPELNRGLNQAVAAARSLIQPATPTLASVLEELLQHLTDILDRLGRDIPKDANQDSTPEVVLLNAFTSVMETIIEGWIKEGKIVKLDMPRPNGTKYMVVTTEVRALKSLNDCLVDCQQFADQAVPVIEKWLGEYKRY